MIQPLLSIIIAVKIAKCILAQVLDSIDAQSFDDYQIFVVDGRFSEKGLTIS
jgi:glycosyltransferase involved in cell wall biosynthesis